MSVHVKERYYPGGALKFRHFFLVRVVTTQTAHLLSGSTKMAISDIVIELARENLGIYSGDESAPSKVKRRPNGDRLEATCTACQAPFWRLGNPRISMRGGSQYYLNNRPHRLDGPAQEAFTETGRRTTAAYWLNGKKFSKSDHRRLIALDKINTQLHPDHNFSL